MKAKKTSKPCPKAMRSDKAESHKRLGSHKFGADIAIRSLRASKIKMKATRMKSRKETKSTK